MIYFLIFFVVLSLFSSSLKLLIISNFILYIKLFKRENYIKFHQFISKYFYFLITIFLSYFFLAILKDDFIILIEYIKASIILTLKIFIIVSANIIVVKDKILIEKFPKEIRRKIEFISEIFNFAFEELKENIKKLKKRDLIINIDSIITNLIISVIKKTLKNEI